MAIFSTVVFIFASSVGAYVCWKIIAVGFEATFQKPKTISLHSYSDGDEYGDQFYVQMSDGSIRID